MIMNERNMNILFNSSIQKYVLSKFDERGADVFSSSLLWIAFINIHSSVIIIIYGFKTYMQKFVLLFFFYYHAWWNQHACICINRNTYVRPDTRMKNTRLGNLFYYILAFHDLNFQFGVFCKGFVWMEWMSPCTKIRTWGVPLLRQV